MSIKLCWMPFDVLDYEDETRSLTGEQAHAYILLRCVMWRRGDLPDDDDALAMIGRISKTRWLRHVKPAVMPLLTITDAGAVSHKRLQKDREKAAKISGIRAEIARERIHKRGENTPPVSSDINGIDTAIAPSIAGTNVEHVTEQLLVHVHKEEVSKEEHKPSVYDADASPPPIELVQAPAVKEKVAPHPVWSEGLEILGWVANRVRPEDRDAVVRLLRKCQQAAGGDDDMLIDVLRTVHHRMPPGKETVGVIKSMIAERGGIALKNRPRLVIDNNDPHGIQAWCRSLRGVEPTVRDEDRAEGNWMLGGWIVDWVARLVGDAAELPTPCRMDWTLLSTWLADGIEPEFIVRRIKENVAWLNRRGGYTPPSSLGLFDAFIRGARKSA